MESDDENIFITQSKFCDNSTKSDKDISGNFLLMYEDISSASENEATLSKKPIYEDISSASDEELMCTLVDRVDSDLRNKPGPSRLSKIVSDNKIEELSVRRSVYICDIWRVVEFFSENKNVKKCEIMPPKGVKRTNTSDRSIQNESGNQETKKPSRKKSKQKNKTDSQSDNKGEKGENTGDNISVNKQFKNTYQ
ncbi:unnamed protein product [Mytilus edulis]|uniref:Uncharacterized protein n=1 Tax=Mytilus edulis TaxID=6550 RepID=A0A8S3U9P4_MYTED|nr:unnamed protein product [Mytilus edulis]